MPTNRHYRTKLRRQQIDELNRSLEYELLHGKPLFPFPGSTFDDDDLMLRAWELHRERLLAEWLDAHPGTRPFAWWKFEAVPKHGERRLTTDGEAILPYREAWEKHGILHTRTIPPMQELEIEYLRRHGYLLDGEEERFLAAEDD